MQFIAGILNHPAQVLFACVIMGLFFLRFAGLSYADFIRTTNTIGTQPFALIVLIIGFWMLVCCKVYGIDTTIAGGVIGVASNMLQSQIKDASHLTPSDLPPNSSVSQTTKIDNAATASTTISASQPVEPEVKP